MFEAGFTYILSKSLMNTRTRKKDFTKVKSFFYEINPLRDLCNMLRRVGDFINYCYIRKEVAFCNLFLLL